MMAYTNHTMRADKYTSFRLYNNTTSHRIIFMNGQEYEVRGVDPGISQNDLEAIVARQLQENWIDAEHTPIAEHPVPKDARKDIFTRACFTNHDVRPICSVCQYDIDSGLELHCRHAFHDECINAWIDRQSTCPVCRVEIKSM